MRWIVLYDDDYPDLGGVGWEYFESQQEALDFIKDRIDKHRKNSLSGYTLIEGSIQKLVIKETIKTIGVE